MSLAVEVQNLTKRYEDVTAVDHINFKVKKGEIFGFLDQTEPEKPQPLES